MQKELFLLPVVFTIMPEPVNACIDPGFCFTSPDSPFFLSVDKEYEPSLNLNRLYSRSSFSYCAIQKPVFLRFS